MENKNIYNKFNQPEMNKLHSANWTSEEKLLGSKPEKNNENNLVFSVPLEFGETDRDGEREVTKELFFDRGKCFLIEDQSRTQISFREAGALVKKCGRWPFLGKEKRDALGGDDLKIIE
jgi:hypothetical protein